MSRSDMLVELATELVNQIVEMVKCDEYKDVHTRLQPIFLAELALDLAHLDDHDFARYYNMTMGVDTPSSPPLSSEARAEQWSAANAQEKTSLQVLDEAIEACQRHVSEPSGVDDLTVSLLHTLRDAKSLGEVAPESAVPAEIQASVHWY